MNELKKSIHDVLSRKVNDESIEDQISLLNDLRTILSNFPILLDELHRNLIKSRYNALNKLNKENNYLSLKDATSRKQFLEFHTMREETELLEVEVLRKEVHYAIEATRTIISALKNEKIELQRT